jgi:hypothetical protein
MQAKNLPGADDQMLWRYLIVIRKRIKFVLSVLAIIFILTNLFDNAVAADWPDCKFQCRAGDVSVLEVYLGDSYGNHLQDCTLGNYATAHLWIRINNNANSERRALILLTDIYINNLLVRSLWAEEGINVLDVVPPGTSLFDIYDFSYTCGQKIELRNLVLSWDTNGNANKKCAERTTQCYRASTIDVWTPMNRPTVQIQGDNITCIAIPSIYTPQITGQFIPIYQASWSIDGSEIVMQSSDNSIEVDWEHYGEGQHLLQLTVKFVDELGQLWYIDHSQMNILVVDVPNANIESV